MEGHLKITIFSYLDPKYSRTGVFYVWAKELGVDIKFVKVNSGFKNSISTLKNNIRSKRDFSETFIVGSPSHLLVLIFRLISRNKIYLDAGWSLTESTIIRSKNKMVWLKNYLIDYFAFRVAQIIFVESKEQLKYIKAKFNIPEHKMFVSYTGFDEISIKNSLKVRPQEISNLDDFVLVRGKNVKESGLENILNLAPFFPHIHFVFVTNTKPFDLIHPNVTWINRTISNGELAYLYEHCRLVFGQISDSERLKRTIPHKCFEALYFEKPYLAIKTPSMLEVFPSDYPFFINFDENFNVNIMDKLNSHELQTKAKEYVLKIKNRFSQENLSREFLSNI